MSGMNWFKQWFVAKSNANRVRKGVHPRLEVLDTRNLLAAVTITVTIPELIETDDPDPGPLQDDGDYYPIVQIGNNPAQTGKKYEDDDHITGAPWTFTNTVDTLSGPVRVSIVMMDTDSPIGGIIGGALGGLISGGLFTGGIGALAGLAIGNDDDLIDINPRGGASALVLIFNPLTGTWGEEGGAFSSPQNFSEGNGDDDGSAKIFFSFTRTVPDPTADTDGDALLDTWEIFGIDAPGSPPGIDFVLPGANPDHKNLYVEVDAM